MQGFTEQLGPPTPEPARPAGLHMQRPWRAAAPRDPDEGPGQELAETRHSTHGRVYREGACQPTEPRGSSHGWWAATATWPIRDTREGAAHGA